MIRFFATVDAELSDTRPPSSTAPASSIRKPGWTSSRPTGSAHLSPSTSSAPSSAPGRPSDGCRPTHGGAGGSIVNLSSAAARLGSPGEYVDYAASKGAIDTMTIGLAREVAGEGIRVNAVRPGLVDTDIHASGGQPDRIERLAPVIPMGRGGRPMRWPGHRLAVLAEASYVTGALIDVSGGR